MTRTHGRGHRSGSLRGRRTARARAAGAWALAAAMLPPAGCLAPTPPDALSERVALRNNALGCLKRAAQYHDNPIVRAGAVEGLQIVAPDEGREWIRAGLLDAHPGVRFAACVAIGEMKDVGALEGVQRVADDPDASVRAAAAFALHRLGLRQRSALLPEFLLTHHDPLVRCNAAMLLGRLGDKSASPILARAMRDRDPRVQNEALAAMGALGVPEAISQLAFLANSGIGSQETFAVTALSATKQMQHIDLLMDRLQGAAHLETRLTAARGLAWLGRQDGIELALNALNFNQPRQGEPDDPPEAQIVRVRALAIDALGAMDDPRVLPALNGAMLGSSDPRLQVVAARAILGILQRQQIAPSSASVQSPAKEH